MRSGRLRISVTSVIALVFSGHKIPTLAVVAVGAALLILTVVIFRNPRR
jgi:hypothetical protein